jgi:hypothetical protein
MLIALMDDEDARVRAGHAARDRFRREFDTQVVAPQLLSFLYGTTADELGARPLVPLRHGGGERGETASRTTESTGGCVRGPTRQGRPRHPSARMRGATYQGIPVADHLREGCRPSAGGARGGRPTGGRPSGRSHGRPAGCMVRKR